MKWTRQIIIILSLLVFPATAFAAGQGEEEPLDVKTMLFEHIGDSYQWHITRIGDKDISVPLPVIVKSSTGWHCFLSSRLEEGPYEGLYLAEGGKYDGKIVEKDASGNEVRPFDISVTKNVLGLMINSLILVILVLGCSRWYRKHDVLKEAPTGVASLMEPVIEMINDDVIKGSIPGKLGEKFAPYLLTCAVVAQGPCTSHPVHGVHRHIHQAVCADDKAFRQYSRGTCHHPELRFHHFHNCEDGASGERYDDSGVGAFRGVHGLHRASCGIHPGLCVHHAFGSVHRPGA